MNSGSARAFVEETYRRAFEAHAPAGFSDYLTGPGAARAALGYRRATADPLFLERYLDQPVECAVSAALGHRVERGGIVEIGNLAAENAWSMIGLWGAAANDLGGSSEVVVATLTAALRRMFARISVPVWLLAPADPARLGASAADWGSYYLCDPWVCAGPIAQGQKAIATFLARRQRERAA